MITIEKGFNFKFITRPNTTDAQVIKEVITKNQYQQKGIKIEKNDIWLDLGANIGTFTVLASLNGAKVISFEPEPENYSLLCKNISINGCKDVITYQSAISMKNGTTDLYLGSTDYQKYTHTLFPIRGRKSIKVKVKSILSLLKKVNAIKMDIEGSEIEILETIENWYSVKKLVFEYSFNRDKSIPRFLAIIEKLRKHFGTIIHKKMPDTETYDYFPSGILVYCKL